ncbi:MAG: site-2 protease family protein [Clostridia bacterium]|nr:site-2 protease family protein [Clostridia bacterium]
MIDFLIELLISVPVVLIALTFHECAHGFVAYLCGDNTAKSLGRLSLNPIKHIDIIGAICMLLFRFGWAKPVPINARYFKKPKRDIALSALAGPVANILLGFIGCFLYSLSLHLLENVSFASQNFAYWLCYSWLLFLFNFAWLNISLALFNLIPLPPLDGSRILFAFLPDKAYFKVMRYEREIALGFFAILFIDNRFLNGTIVGWLSYLVNLIFNSMMSLFSLFF